MRKIFLKIMCITVLSLVMSITMLSSVSAKEASIEYQGLWTDYAAKEYDAGDGTKESPYLIKDASQLALLAKNVNEKEEKDKYYELISDIDLSGHFWNPVGYVKRKLNFFSGGNYFYGVFEGNNHTIKNLNIIQNNPNDDNYYYGLFAWNSGTIQNLNVINANIDCDGVSYIGGIASVNVGDINQCSFEGSISVSNDAGDIAGIVGRQEDGGTVNHCKNKAQIKATTQDCNYLGGIVGYNEYGCIRDCVNEGEIIGNSRIGGIAGENDGFNGHSYIERCINLGNIKGNGIIGGITGENFRTASIINCENIGHITGTMYYVGGIAGAAGVLKNDKKEIKYCINIGKIECDSYGNAIVGALYAGSSECAISLKNCCYLETSAKVGYEEYDIPGNYEISEIKALSTLKELVQQEIYKDFDFTNVWKISKYYPIVKNLDFDESLLEKPNVHEHSYDILKYDETGHWKECLCGDKTEKQQHILEVRNQKQATCTEDGYSGDQYCKDCGLKVKSGSKLKALGHVWDTGTITKEATCTEDGERTYTCARCNDNKVEEIPATGHKIVIDKMVSATCTKPGKIEGSHCSVCEEVLVEQKTIPATGHSWSEWQVVREATVTNAGEKQRTCTKCGELEKQSIAKIIPASTPTPAPTKAPQPTVASQPTNTPAPTVAPTKPSTITVTKGKTTSVKSDSSWKNVKYSTSNKKVATVDKKGKVKAVAAGTVKITVKSGSQKAVYTIVVPGTTAIKGVKSSVSVKKGKSYTLKPKLSYTEKADKVTYKSSNKKIATVSKKGVIKGKKKGTATITIKSGKITKKCKVKVK